MEVGREGLSLSLSFIEEDTGTGTSSRKGRAALVGPRPSPLPGLQEWELLQRVRGQQASAHRGK